MTKRIFSNSSILVWNLFFLYVFFFSSCADSSRSLDNKKDDTLKVSKNIQKPVSTLEKKMIDMGLVDVQKIDSTIAVDIKYSTTDNFMKRDVYGDFDKAYLQKEVAVKLAKAEQYLDKLKKGYRLIVYDAARPQSVQKFMWDSVNIPFSKKINYIANPLTGSLHSYGCAVDISILDSNNKALDMGTPFDYMDVEAGSGNESVLMDNGLLKQLQTDNRKLLRQVMQYAGFFNVQSEWWHFNACRIEEAKKKYKIIE